MAATARSNGDATVVVDRKVLDYDQLLAEYRENDERPPILFHVGAREFTIPAPLDWSDDLVEMQASAQSNPESVNPVAMAKAFLGEEQYAEFKAAGGTAMHFNMVLLPKALGATVGESSAS
jgi:hypothetical protein